MQEENNYFLPQIEGEGTESYECDREHEKTDLDLPIEPKTLAEDDPSVPSEVEQHLHAQEGQVGSFKGIERQTSQKVDREMQHKGVGFAEGGSEAP